MKIEGIVAFSFGAPSSISSNLMITSVVLQKAQESAIPIFAQRGIAPIQKGRVDISYADKNSEGWSILKMARAAIVWALSSRVNYLWVVGAWPCLWRCWRDLEEAAQEKNIAIDICPCEGIMDYSYEKWFCANSTQTMTKSLAVWNKREWLLRTMPLAVYKHLAA